MIHTHSLPLSPPAATISGQPPPENFSGEFSDWAPKFSSPPDLPDPHYHSPSRASSPQPLPLPPQPHIITTGTPLQPPPSRSPTVALSDPNWRDAMYHKYNALIKNSTWVLVLKPPNVNVARSMWLFRHKYHADGSLSRHKARLVANGCSHHFGVDCDDTFCPVVKPATIRTVLSLALSRNWPIHQLDVKNAFLNGDLYEIVYMYQPPGYAYRVGLSSSHCDSSLFIYQDGSKKYALELLDRAHIANCNPTRTPVDTESKLGSDGDPISDPTLYRSLAGDNLLSWSAKRQHTLSRSSAEAEYKGVANVVAKTSWLRNLFRELHTPLLFVTLVYCDNVCVLHVPSRYQYADIFPKGLPFALFEEFRKSLSVRPSPAQIAGEC
ncbi:ribonuclease H-like domain-containing protein [Tanacetum coccineum]